jgi:hypothetical protein
LLLLLQAGPLLERLDYDTDNEAEDLATQELVRRLVGPDIESIAAKFLSGVKTG